MCEYGKIVKIVHEWLKSEKHFAEVIYYITSSKYIYISNKRFKEHCKAKSRNSSATAMPGQMSPDSVIWWLTPEDSKFPFA